MPRMATRTRLVAFKVTSAVVSVLVACLAVEFGYRCYLDHKYASSGYGVTIVDADIHAPTTGYMTPNLDFHWRMFDASHALVHEAHVKTNAQGFISAKDYPIEKSAKEFRIALIGDSFTACITNDFPWGDALEDELNRDEGFKKKVNADVVRVMNFGTPGAGFHFFARNYVRYAQRFSPDLVVVNYIEDDFPREGDMNLVDDLDALAAAAEPPMAYARVQSARIRVLGNYSEELVRQYGDPFRIPGLALSSFFVIEDDRVAFDKAAMDSIKSELAERYFRPRLWHTWRSHALSRLLGRRFQLEPQGAAFPPASPGIEARVVHAAQGIRAIQKRNARLLVLRNPVYTDLSGKPDLKYTEPLEAALNDIEVVRMEAYLPVARGADDIYKWFNLPSDGHWSNYGAKLYSAAVHQALAERMPAATDDAMPPAATAQSSGDAKSRR
jgi:GDSL-like Lipase/Acylhydrolase